NQLAQAERLLNVYLPLARDVGLPDHMILSHVMRSRLAFHAGDIDAAFQALTELEYLGHARQLPRVVAGAKLERSRMLLLQGNGPASHDELLRADDPALW
ncbi:helix-turn-helix transcriptional regulator, partial [Mycobacterium tuberculosis]